LNVIGDGRILVLKFVFTRNRIIAAFIFGALVLGFQNCGTKFSSNSSAGFTQTSLGLFPPNPTVIPATPTPSIANDILSGLISNSNRHYIEAFGGWNPALRGLMRNKNGSLWYVVDRGPSVILNSDLDYYTKQNGSWQLVTTQPQIPGVQQNVASVLLAQQTIATYGISTTSRQIEECLLDTLNISAKTCKPIAISGAVFTADYNSNYIGAAIASDGITRMVWWTTVGSDTSSGVFNYIYNFGGGWNGPISSPVAGYTSLSYIAGQLVSPSQFVGVGELVSGLPSDATTWKFHGTAVSIQLGMAPRLSPLVAPGAGGIQNSALTFTSGTDSYFDMPSNSLHILGRGSDGSVRYFYAKLNAMLDLPASGIESRDIFPSNWSARFLVNSSEVSSLMSGAANNIEVRTLGRSNLSEPIDWKLARLRNVAAPSAQFGGASGIYIEGSQYQSTAITGMNFAATGAYQVGDEKIYHFYAP
jgi:hypothetical protein